MRSVHRVWAMSYTCPWHTVRSVAAPAAAAVGREGRRRPGRPAAEAGVLYFFVSPCVVAVVAPLVPLSGKQLSWCDFCHAVPLLPKPILALPFPQSTRRRGASNCRVSFFIRFWLKHSKRGSAEGEQEEETMEKAAAGRGPLARAAACPPPLPAGGAAGRRWPSTARCAPPPSPAQRPAQRSVHSSSGQVRDAVMQEEGHRPGTPAAAAEGSPLATTTHGTAQPRGGRTGRGQAHPHPHVAQAPRRPPTLASFQGPGESMRGVAFVPPYLTIRFSGATYFSSSS